MTYSYTASVNDLRLRDKVGILDGDSYVTGKVIGLSLLGDDMTMARVTLELEDDGVVRSFDRPRDSHVFSVRTE